MDNSEKGILFSSIHLLSEERQREDRDNPILWSNNWKTLYSPHPLMLANMLFIRIALSEKAGKNWRTELKEKPEILDEVMPILKRAITDLLMIQHLIVVEISF